jgi:UDP-N-acetylglucosamine 2-epimerase (non-hydrolysing)
LNLIDIIVGARPNFVKAAALIRAFNLNKKLCEVARLRLIHTGQHYDDLMSKIFFEQLDIPPPDFNLEVGNGSQAEQTAGVMLGYEKIIDCERPDICVVFGDVNSTMAAAVTAKKNGVTVCHVEAGIRSGDMDMPEEINRILTDSITDIFFTTSISAGENLRTIGVSDKKIYFVGNTMIDTLMHKRNDFVCPDVWFMSGLKPQNYLLLTLHRPSNVSDYANLQNILETICSVRGDIPIVFPVHPRTQKSISKLNSLPKQLLCIDPLPYLEFMYLVNSAVAVITDSGGITEEATVLNVPCLTVRDNTERPETVEIGSNSLVGSDPLVIKRVLDSIFSGSYKKSAVPNLWDGKASERICECILNVLNS